MSGLRYRQCRQRCTSFTVAQRRPLAACKTTPCAPGKVVINVQMRGRAAINSVRPTATSLSKASRKRIVSREAGADVISLNKRP